MIISELTGGLGNQLFQYAVGFAVAERRKTSFRLDLRHYDYVYPGNPPRPYVLDRLNISAKPINMLDRFRLTLNAVAGRMPPLEQRMRRLPLRHFQKIVDAANGFDPRLNNPPRDCYLVGCWQSERFFADFRDKLLLEFTFKQPPGAENRAVLGQITGQPSVCLHVRRGDYILASTLTKPCSTDYYDRALVRMKADVPEAKYFIFSDEPDWARTNLPLPQGATFVAHNVGIADFEDLRLMSACDHFIIANSTFSWWGAWLSKAPNKRVIAPAKWYAGPHGSERDLVPKSWMRM